MCRVYDTGGRFNAFGVVFTNKPSPNPAFLVAPDISRAVRIFGGELLSFSVFVIYRLLHPSSFTASPSSNATHMV